MSQRRTRFGGVFWVLFLLSIGSVVLLRGLGYPMAVGEEILRYWPASVPAWALVKLIDYRQFRGTDRTLFSRGEVACLVSILIAGSALTTAVRLGSNLSALGVFGEDLDLFDVVGESFEFVSTIESEVQPGNRIEIRNQYGSVDVEPGDSANIVVHARTKVRSDDPEEAELMNSEMHFTIRQREDGYLIESNQNDLGNSIRRRFKSSLQVHVPVNSEISVRNRYGSVQLTGLSGSQEIENRYGDVRVIVRELAQHGVSIVGENADVVLALPPTSSFTLSAKTTEGSIESNFEGMQTVTTGPKSLLVGERGRDGPRILIETRRGNVTVEAR
jgi:hypothetical protein